MVAEGFRISVVLMVQRYMIISIRRVSIIISMTRGSLSVDGPPLPGGLQLPGATTGRAYSRRVSTRSATM